ncbi:formate dehydrogenase subunit delta [Streptomyces sp. NRRL S-813]|uniref:formate dehydrogenase subunit delta n=1 Tax=Streptomyces sp. NRRL S-813 TaxID=1463919 RepID=UPI0004BE8200|nr:formate dehydrogenase subunit delta [Streptomyces sp. NRRL S-813]
MTALVPSEQRMANQIAANLAHVPAGQAAEMLAGHIERFWDPRMRARLLELVDAEADDLHPVVVMGAGMLRKSRKK